MPGERVADRDELLGEGLEAAVIFDVLLDFFGALGGDALAEFAAVSVALEQEIGSLLA